MEEMDEDMILEEAILNEELDDNTGSLSPSSPEPIAANNTKERRRMPKRRVKSRRYKLKKARDAILAARRGRAGGGIRSMSPMDIKICAPPLGSAAPLRLPSPEPLFDNGTGEPECMPMLDPNVVDDSEDDIDEVPPPLLPLTASSSSSAPIEVSVVNDELPPPPLSPCNVTTVKIDLGASRDVSIVSMSPKPKMLQRPRFYHQVHPGRKGKPPSSKPITFIPPKGVVNFLPDRGIRTIPAQMPKELKRKGKQRPAKLSKDSYQMILDVYHHFVARQVGLPKEETAAACRVSRKTLDRLLKREANPELGDLEDDLIQKPTDKPEKKKRRPKCAMTTDQHQQSTSSMSNSIGGMSTNSIGQPPNAVSCAMSQHQHQQQQQSTPLPHGAQVQHLHHPSLQPHPPIGNNSMAPLPMPQRPIEMSALNAAIGGGAADDRSYVTLKPFFFPAVAPTATTSASGGDGTFSQRPHHVGMEQSAAFLLPPSSQQSLIYSAVADLSWESLQQHHQLPAELAAPAAIHPPPHPPTSSYHRR